MNIKFEFNTSKLLSRMVGEFKCKEYGCLHPDEDGCDNCIVMESVMNAEQMMVDEIDNHLEDYLSIKGTI